jgi:tetratricopeptide (TPR) repeat protein
MTTGTKARWPLLVALAAVLVNFNSLGNGFALDDVALVADNTAIRSLARAPHLFVEGYGAGSGEHSGLYRPATVVSLAVNRAVTGERPVGFHAVNVVLSALVAALAWFAIRRVGTHYGTAMLGGLLFAVHPLHSEAIANVAGRAELLAALFVLAAWLAHAAGRRIAAPLLFLAAILSKEGVVLAPLLFWADDRLRGERRPFSSYAGYLGALVVLAVLRIAALGAYQGADSAIPLDNPAAAAGSVARVFTAAWVQLKYALLCVWPHPLSSDYSFDVIPVAHSVFDPRVVAGTAFLAVAAASVVWGWRRSRPVALAGLLWIVFFLPSSNLFFPTGTIMAERLAYLPSLGLCLAVGHAGCAWAQGNKLRARAVLALSLATVALLGTLTWRRNLAWTDNLTLATTDVAAYPDSAKLQAGAGIFLAAAGRDAEAEAHLRRAIEIYPDYAQIHYNLAVLLARRGARDEAIDHLRRAIALAPDNPRPRALLDRLAP